VQSYGKDISTVGQNDGLISSLYAFLTLAIIGAGFAYLFVPVPTLNAVFGPLAGKGPEDVFRWQLIGGGLATLVGPIAFTERVRTSALFPPAPPPGGPHQLLGSPSIPPS
jgi:hypothetical protein